MQRNFIQFGAYERTQVKFYVQVLTMRKSAANCQNMRHYGEVFACWPSSERENEPGGLKSEIFLWPQRSVLKF